MIKLQGKLDFTKSQNAKAIKRDKEITLRQKEIERLSEELARSRKTNRSLNKRIKKLKQIGKAEKKSSVKAVKKVASFNREAIEAADRHFGLHNSVVLLEDASGGGTAAAEVLIAKSIRAVIVKNDMSDAAQRRFREADVPVLSMAELPIELFSGLTTVDNDALDLAILESKRQMSEAKQFEALRRLESLIEAYKHQRVASSHRNG